MRFKSKYYKRNLSIYVFIYILSIITLLMMIVNSLNTFLQSEIETNIKMNLEKPLTSIDENLNLINRIVIDICDNEELFLKPKLENGYSKSLINKALKDYLFVNAFYEDLIFYYRGSNEVFSTDDYDTKTKFFSQSYNFIDKSEDEVEFWLNKSKEPMLVPATKILRYGHIEKKVILYVFPILNREPEATAIFVIDNEWFYNNLNSLNNKYDCSISLYSSNNLITELQFAEQQKNNRQLFFELNNHPRRISMKVSINKAGIYRPLYSVYIIISVYVIGLLLAGLFLITYFTRRAYIPIMNLKRMFEIEEKDNREKFVLENKDDFDVIRSGIKKIQGLNSDLQNSLYERDEKLRCMTIKNILNFEQADEEINNMIFVEKDTNGNKIYQRILFVLSKDEHVSNMCFDLLCNLNNLNVYQLESEYDDASIFLVRYTKNIEDEVTSIFNDVITKLKEKYNCRINFILGKSVDNIYKIKHSYMCAENGYYDNVDVELRFIDEEPKINRYPSRQVEIFEKALLEGDMTYAVETINSINDYVLNVPLHMFIKKCVVFELCNIILKTKDLYNNSEVINIVQEMLDNYNSLKSKDFDKMLEKVMMCINMLSVEVSKRSNSELVKKCCEYINSNFFDYELSVQQIADKLEISATILNQQMKKEVQMNVHEYISYIRMENAKYMLANTALPVKSIVEYIGYVDVSSFGRKFKIQTGMTLTEYRKKSQKE